MTEAAGDAVGVRKDAVAAAESKTFLAAERKAFLAAAQAHVDQVCDRFCLGVVVS